MKSHPWLLAFALVLLPALSPAQTMPADVAGGKDHPALSRYAGSWLVATESKEFDAATIPSGPKDGQTASLEGRIMRHVLPRAGRPFGARGAAQLRAGAGEGGCHAPRRLCGAGLRRA
ncbi:MAG: hypothetical protein U5L03_03025 [Burkholderiaceae bacterium]|nr:hypothetical protein [Burkholderiaceae bacterium]